MGTVQIVGSQLGNNLTALLTSQDILPGDPVSYQLCKTLYTYHPLGLKMAESPIRMAQSQQREISIPDSPEDDCKEAFIREWKKIKADRIIFRHVSTARIYGIASIGLMCKEVKPSDPVDYWNLHELDISFNIFDPLNTAGSLVLNQDPNAIDFQHVTSIRVAGVSYHRSRSCVLMNEDPIYIEFTSSAFGFVGRSVYQRALYPMKSFVQTMITDDLVTLKAGVFIAMLKQAGSLVDSLMQKLAGVKRQLLKEAVVGNVLSIEESEKIETLNMQNLDGAFGMARKDIIENIATAADMPAKLLLQETFAEGFGEGTEDAKHVAQYVERLREEMQPDYDFMDEIVQHRAWNPDFYKAIQNKYPEYENVDYKTAFMKWRNSFAAQWPSLLREPESERIKVDDVKLKAAIAVVQILEPMLDPDNKALVIRWLCDCFNQQKMLFQDPLELDFSELEDFLAEKAEQAEQMQAMGEAGEEELESPKAPKLFSAADNAMRSLTDAVARLPDQSRATVRQKLLELRKAG